MTFLPMSWSFARGYAKFGPPDRASPATHPYRIAGPGRDRQPPCQCTPFLLDCAGGQAPDPAAAEACMIPFFVQIKCKLGKSYDVANALAESEIASEIYSTAGDFDLLVKFYVEKETDIGHFVNEKVQTIAGIQDTRTIITFKAF
jgi:Lrp/AsnC ligand binding domain